MSGREKVLLAASLAAAAVLSAPTQAWGFCRTHACCTTQRCLDESPHLECVRDANNCLVNDFPLEWPTSCLSFGVQEDGSRKRGIDYATTHQIVVDAFNMWLNADCGGGLFPSVDVNDFGKIECNKREYNSNQPNANVFMYRDDRWPYENAEDTLALTTITFNTKNAEIYDADVEINSFDAELTVSNTEPVADLQSILTHEIGHFLGLSHSNEPGATMRPGYRPGGIELRTLDPDDIAGMCAIYSPNRDVPDAECEPRHGFSRQCAGADEGCTVNGVPGSPSRSSALFVLSVAGLAGARRWKRRSRRS